jgi:hypothetical protein
MEKMTKQAPPTSTLARLAKVAVVVPLIVLLIPIVLALILAGLAYSALLTVLVWLIWCTRGTDTLIVYSDSPNWREYMLENILPRVQHRAVVLNWSERRLWKRYSLPVVLFHWFAGSREFNPVAIVFRPLQVPRTFRFWKAFRANKHGDGSLLRDVERHLFSALGSTDRG